MNSRRQFRFAKEPGSNPTSCVLDVQTLGFYCFSSNMKGNIYTLIMDVNKCSFPAALRYVVKELCLDSTELEKPTRLPFGGFYKELIGNNRDDENETNSVLPNSALEPYGVCSNIMFLKDGIDLKTQEFFHLGFDPESSRITVPEFTMNGELCGIMGRQNDPCCAHEERWLPIISCHRKLTLYGYHTNYRNIVDKQIVVLFESEKAVMQTRSFGSNVTLATCGCHISTAQSKYIKAMMPKKIIVAYDEGLEEEAVREQCKKLQSDNIIYQNKVGYVWDEEGLWLPKGSKMNAADAGREAYTDLLKTKVRWLDGNS